MQEKCTFSHVLQDSNDDNNRSPANDNDNNESLANDNDNRSPASNYRKNESISESHVELCEIDNCNDFHQALTNPVITYVASLYDSFSFSEEEIQKVIECHKTLLGAGFLMI